jgi:hypothetical protein
MKEKLTILSERFEAVADAPAGKKVSNTFSKVADESKSIADARFERLVELRKASRK